MDRFAALALESSLRAAIVIAGAGVATGLLKRRSAELRHLVWLAALIATLAIPVLVALAPRWNLPVLPMRSRAGATAASSAASSVPQAAAATTKRVEPRSNRLPLPALPIVWSIGCLALLAREIGSRRNLHRLLDGSRFSLALHRSLRTTTNELGLSTNVRCRLSSQVPVPLVFGDTRATILLPDAAERWDRACIRRVLLHELAHVRRRDPLWITLAHAVRALFWFHPLVWLAAERLRQESEHACDDAVVRGGERASDYAETLLFVADHAASREIPMAMAFVTRSALESRILGILSTRRDRRVLGAARRGLIAGTAALVALAFAVTRPVAAVASPGYAAPTPAAAGSGSRAWLARAEKSPRVSAPFRNDGAPVRIVDASVRVVPRADGDETGITGVELTLQNDDRARRVTAVRLALDLPRTRDRTECAIAIAANGRGRLVLGTSQWSAVMPEGDAARLLVRITAVRFDRGEAWELAEPELAAPQAPAEPRGGATATPAPAAPVARAEKQPASPALPAPTPRPRPEGPPRTFPSGAAIAARFRNPDEAPIVILAARTPARDAEAGPGETLLPEVKLENRSGHRLLAVKMRFKAAPESHAVTVFSTSIEPGATAVLWRDFAMQGRAADMTVQVVGARFDNGEVWGSMDSLIDARDAWVSPLTNEPR